ncbi:hypothetical protein CHS0354_033224 [Potamilus streckersoni]|uniref:Uncharacterized protein n=1 Tax=Potamilus streckersoni TaxID=2493646 RepID=A0AAE0S6I5_9BIVA|nr:hypothetical protein CHS0354_033224 [Potamilus streckersoni]
MSRYDVEKFDPIPDPDLICCICQCVLDGAVECPCRHVFCRVCIETWLNNKHTCPTCRDTLSKTDLKPVLPLVQNMLNRLLMFCDFHINGCQEKIMMEHFEAHVKICGYERCVCRFAKCGLSILRKHLKQHEDDECEHRESQCTQGCSLMVPVNQAVTHNCIQALKDHITEKNNLIETLKSRLQELNCLTQSLNEQIEELRRHVEEPQNDSFISDTSDTDFTDFSSDVSMHGDEDENQISRHAHIIHTDNPASPDDNRVVQLPQALEVINFENRYSLRSRTTQQQQLPTLYQAGVNVSVSSSVSSTSQTSHQPQTSTSNSYFSTSVLSPLPTLQVSSSLSVNQNLSRFSDMQMSHNGNRSSQQNSNQSSLSAADSGTLQVAPASVSFHSESNNNQLDMSSEPAEPEEVDSDSALSTISQIVLNTFDRLAYSTASSSIFVDESEDGNGEDNSGDDDDDDNNYDHDYYSEQRYPSSPGSNSSFHSSWTNTNYQSEHSRSSPANGNCDNRSVSAKSPNSTLQSARSCGSSPIHSGDDDWGIFPSHQSHSSSISTRSLYDSENKNSSPIKYSPCFDFSDEECSSRHSSSSSNEPQTGSRHSLSIRSEQDSAHSYHDEDAASSFSNRTRHNDDFAVNEDSQQLAVDVAEQSHVSDWNGSDAGQKTSIDDFESDASFSPPGRYVESQGDSEHGSLDGVKSESVTISQHSGSNKSHSSSESNSTIRSPSSSESTETVISHASNTPYFSGLDGSSSDSEGWASEEAADDNQLSEEQPSKHINHGVYRTSTQTSNSLTSQNIDQLWSKSRVSSSAVQLPTVTSSGDNHHWNQTDPSAIIFKSERSSVNHVITSTHHNGLHSTNKPRSNIVQVQSEAPVIVITDSEEEASKRSFNSKPVQRKRTEKDSQPSSEQPRDSLTLPQHRLFSENNQQRPLPGYSGLGTSSNSSGTKDIIKKRKFDSVSEHLVNGTSLPSYKRCKVETVGTHVWGQSNSAVVAPSVPPSVNVQIDLSLFNISGSTLLGQPLVPTVVPENSTHFSGSAEKKAVTNNSSTQVPPLFATGVANGDAQNRNALKENNSGFAVCRPVETVDTRRVEHGTSSRCKPIAIMSRNNVYNGTNIASIGGRHATQQTSDQDLSDSDGTDNTWEPEDNSLQMSDDTISDDIESDESYEVLVPKSVAELLDECDSDDTDVSWIPDLVD